MNECKPIDWETIKDICWFKDQDYPLICNNKRHKDVETTWSKCSKENCPVWDEL